MIGRILAWIILAAGLLILLGLLAMLGTDLVQERDRADQQVQARQIKIDSLELTIAMVNQETGLRGYSYSAETVFLEPYSAGQAAAVAGNADCATVFCHAGSALSVSCQRLISS